MTRFRKKLHELREKTQRLRNELYELRAKHRQGHPHWQQPTAVRAHYERLCETLQLNPRFYQLSFFTQRGRPAMAFQLNRPLQAQILAALGNITEPC